MKSSRLIVFPVEGRRWSFNTSSYFSPSTDKQESSLNWKQLWRRIASSDHSLSFSGKAELITHFVSDKMQQKWVALEMAPVGSIRHRVYNLGQQLLMRVKPSEMFLKSIPKETTKVEIVFPSSLNPRLVRRRLRCVATSGAIYHRRYMYGSVALLPFTALFAVLPFPNIPLFWNLFRAHAHWQALKGSERLLFLVSDSIETWKMIAAPDNKDGETVNSSRGDSNVCGASCAWVLCPCRRLGDIIASDTRTGALSNLTISTICITYNIDYAEVLKWRDYKL
ncbi:uncharacterized protein LOC131062007 isoform X1 [Cryptomeria japonica]|uniref:uncharacterized protein LOC131062007 isoform X1 n=2 Tax=Cryptomeria japonica TaxID=3369 RepID=UPI0025ACA194|nr:uncharacterized protein LOC131062007 isoform X1 [Cryptomeria japonica]